MMLCMWESPKHAEKVASGSVTPCSVPATWTPSDHIATVYDIPTAFVAIVSFADLWTANDLGFRSPTDDWHWNEMMNAAGCFYS